MRDSDNIRQVMALGVDCIGMIFWDGSPRYVTQVPDIVSARSGLEVDGMPVAEAPLCSLCGVFVDAMPQVIIDHVVRYHLDGVQFHGHEPLTLLRNLKATLDPDTRPGIRFIKAIPVSSREDFLLCRDYDDSAVDCFLFDTKCKNRGGSGEHFDWTVLDAYTGDKPFLLSGGIGPDDVASLQAACQHPRCLGIDLNSRFETAPALKDVDRLRTFIQEIRNTQP